MVINSTALISVQLDALWDADAAHRVCALESSSCLCIFVHGLIVLLYENCTCNIKDNVASMHDHLLTVHAHKT